MLKLALKIIGVITGILSLIFLILSIVLVAFLSSHKNEITRAVLLRLNDIQSGEFTIENVEFNPFRQFPDISINLNNLTYFEKKSRNRVPTEKPVAKINNFYLGLNVVELIQGKLIIRKLLLDGGELAIVTYPDSSINLLNALGLKENETKTEENKDIVINVEQLIFKELHLKFQNYLRDRESLFLLKNLEAGFDYIGQEANLNLITSIVIEEIKLNNNLSIQNKILHLNVEGQLDKNKKLEIKKCQLEYEKSVFNFSGFFDPENKGEILLNIDGSDAGLSLFSQLLREGERKNLKKGDFKFNGSITGKTFIEFPLIDFSFDFKNFELISPTTKQRIKNLNLKGFFNSGKKGDLSKARLKIDTLYADFPNGVLRLSGSVNNFSALEFDTQLYLNADVTGLEKVFNLDFINDLKGKIEIYDRFKGKYLVKEKRLSTEINNANIFLEDLGFDIPGALKIDRINGKIIRKKDDYIFDNLSVLSDDTDFIINGKIENLQYLILNIDKEINADLKIKSSIFDLPNFLAFDPSIKRDFPYRILEIDIDVLAKTTTSKALKFRSFPELVFDIKKLNATAENFLPPLKIKSGGFRVSENLLGFNLKFDNFKTKFLNGEFNFTGEYNSSQFQPYYIKLRTDFKKIFPATLFYQQTDTIPEFLRGKLSGSFFTEIQFPLDSAILKFINLKDGNLVYHSPKDTIELQSFSFNFTDIYSNQKLNQNPLATLSAKGNLKVEKLITKYFIVNESIIGFIIKDGEYEIESGSSRLFGEKAKGKSFWKIKPFAETPTYHIKYDVSEFFVEEMFSVFLEDTIVTGPFSLYMDIYSQGSDWPTIVKDVRGKIKLSGKNLTFYGVDADRLIEKFRRSQNFNLVDLGAVLLAGPVGIAVTKGSDYANMIVSGSGESSNIKNAVSNWELADGEFKILDAAFATNINRVATNGSINFAKDSLDITIALLNKNGCSIFSQRVFGDLNSPKLGKVRVVKTILAPITNLVDDILGIDCDVFYHGSVKHPKQKN